MMFVKTRRQFATLIVCFGLGFVGCAEEEKPVDEVVEASSSGADGEVATPPESVEASSAEEAFGTIYFAFDDYTLSYEAQQNLSATADYLKNNPSAVVQIEGHCDERGSVEYNLALGQKRAQSVKDYLVDLGVDSSRMPTMSYGEERPVASGHDEDAWGQNRRAEFVLSTP